MERKMLLDSIIRPSYPVCPFCYSILSVDSRGRCTECGAPQQLAEPANLEADLIATAALTIMTYQLAAS